MRWSAQLRLKTASSINGQHHSQHHDGFATQTSSADAVMDDNQLGSDSRWLVCGDSELNSIRDTEESNNVSLKDTITLPLHAHGLRQLRLFISGPRLNRIKLPVRAQGVIPAALWGRNGTLGPNRPSDVTR